MERACERAMTVGLPAVAFTDHADFTTWARAGEHTASPVVRRVGTHVTTGELDVESYWASLERCRNRFPGLTILSGVELGEPHIFTAEVETLTRIRRFDRVLGSLHCLMVDGMPTYVTRLLSPERADTVMRDYLKEVLRLVETCDTFEVLAHIDYPKRAWPKNARPFREEDFEEEYRAVLRELSRSGRVLEVNTASPLPGPCLMRWWREEGGTAVSFGSDAHEPPMVADRFTEAAAIVEASGFRSGNGPFDFWRR